MNTLIVGVGALGGLVAARLHASGAAPRRASPSARPRRRRASRRPACA